MINWWLSHFPRNVVVGIEVDKDIARQAQKRLRKYKNVTVISGDAIESIPGDGTIFYLYNPFEAEMVEVVLDRRQPVPIDVQVLADAGAFPGVKD